tara:strand:+ start:164 stop:364 length:201 start_codon:yes stop_codon:yes gene_type:complete
MAKFIGAKVSLMSTNWEDTEWRKDFLEMKTHKPHDAKLLMEGPKNFFQAIHLGSLHSEYKRLGGAK